MVSGPPELKSHGKLSEIATVYSFVLLKPNAGLRVYSSPIVLDSKLRDCRRGVSSTAKTLAGSSETASTNASSRDKIRFFISFVSSFHFLIFI